jgi:hypothetical protein
MKKPDPFTKKLIDRTLKQQSKKVYHRLPKKKAANSSSEAEQKIDCRKCCYFFITWEKPTPYGCKAHGFKSAQIPSFVVFANSGRQCLLFSQRA